MGLMIERGAKLVTPEMVFSVPVPESTDTYQAVSNRQLVDFVKVQMDKTFGFPLEKEEYALARRGNHMFGVLKYDVGFDHGFGIALKNSYDYSMRIATAGGGQYNVCSNTCISGDSFVEMRRHTKNVWKTFTSNFDQKLELMYKDFLNMMTEFDALKEEEITEVEGYELLGVMRGMDKLKPQQETAAFDAWKKPTHEEFEPRNLFSLYNACTEGMKRNNPHDAIQSLAGVHGFFRDLTQEKIAA